MSYDLFVKLIGLDLLLIIAKSLNPGPNLRLFILPVTQAKEAKMPTIPTTKIATSLTGRSVPKIWRQFLDFLFWQKKWQNQAKFKAKPC